MKNKHKHKATSIDWPVLLISGGFLTLFVVASFINGEYVSELVNQSFAFSVEYFGSLYQILVLGFFLVALYLAFSKYGRIKLGKREKPEMSTFKWTSIIMCTLMAGGGVFWAAAEPLNQFLTPPPYFAQKGVETMTEEAVAPALGQSFLHWGFLAWAINGTLSTIILMYVHYHRELPLKPRAFLYPFLGEKVFNKSIIGTIADAVSVIAVAAGTIGPIGFLGLQAGYALHSLFGLPNTFTTQFLIILGLVTVAAISAVTGVDKGIQWLSSFNVQLTVVLCIAVLILGPGMFIFNQFFASLGVYIQNFVGMSTYRGNTEWLGSWTVFFWGWFIGYGPMMAILVSRISRGRSIRQIVLTVSVLAAVIMNFWFTVVGGSGIFFEMESPGSISNALADGGMPAAMIAIIQQLPFGTILAFLFLIATIIFVTTTTDSMSLTIAMAITGDNSPSSFMRVFWAVIMGLVTIILLSFGEGSIGSIQSFIVVTAIPVSLLLLPNIITAPKICKRLLAEQNQIE
ncbi:BCCT family transporter [Bacillus piscicola]|uniref:BCCT family transporter n=1 Tax=Bacillus piscicola TaxID=1632684 RepID=UPI001F096B9B|nr:BCCT family transporter [Bacillus piscicola]